MKLSNRVKNLKPSATLTITAKAKALKAEGIDVIGFGAGEPDFDTPENVKNEAINSIKSGFTKYTAVGGINELKDAIIKSLEDDHGLKYERDEIIVSCGAKHSIYNITQAIFEQGDEVIIPAPYWVSYPDQITLTGAKPVIVETSEKNEFKLQLNDLKDAINKKDLKETIDALTDILYVTYGAGHAFGVNLDKCFEEVQNSNMSKLGEDGKPIYNENGKVMKGPNYFKPNLNQFLK